MPKQDRLSLAMARHLRELVQIADGNPYGDAFWDPANAGEWRCAEAMARRGLLDRYISRGQKPFGLSTAGLEAGRALAGGQTPVTPAARPIPAPAKREARDRTGGVTERQTVSPPPTDGELAEIREFAATTNPSLLSHEHRVVRLIQQDIPTLLAEVERLRTQQVVSERRLRAQIAEGMRRYAAGYRRTEARGGVMGPEMGRKAQTVEFLADQVEAAGHDH